MNLKRLVSKKRIKDSVDLNIKISTIKIQSGYKSQIGRQLCDNFYREDGYKIFGEKTTNNGYIAIFSNIRPIDSFVEKLEMFIDQSGVNCFIKLGRSDFRDEFELNFYDTNSGEHIAKMTCWYYIEDIKDLFREKCPNWF